MIKQNKAITLIALIITIIVLLILAGVVINMTVGNNGIISKAQSAVDLYKNAQEKEEIELAKAEENMQDTIDDIYIWKTIETKYFYAISDGPSEWIRINVDETIPEGTRIKYSSSKSNDGDNWTEYSSFITANNDSVYVKVRVELQTKNTNIKPTLNEIEIVCNYNGEEITHSPEQKKEFDLSVVSQNTSYGTVSNNSGKYKYKESVTVTATPENGYRFIAWSNGINVVSSNSTYTFNMPKSDYTLKAVFASNNTSVDTNSIGLIPRMTGNSSPSGVASGSSGNNGDVCGPYPYYAFDQNVSTFYAQGNNTYRMTGWVQYQFPYKVIVDKIGIVNRSDASDCYDNYPRTFTLYGSNDGSNWTAVQTWTNSSYPTDANWHYFNLDTPCIYQYFKINGTAFDDRLSFGEIQFFGVVE